MSVSDEVDMKKLIPIIIVFLISGFIFIDTSNSIAKGFKDATVALQVGNWTIFRNIDNMTDAIECTGIYKKNYGIQLTKKALYISVRGGIQGITLRFGESPAKPFRLPERMEKEINAISISGSEFTELLEAERLRLSVLTLIEGVYDADLDLNGIKSAIDNIKADCPVQPTISKPETEKQTLSLCSVELITRMKTHGLKEDQIEAICKQ